MYPAEAVDDRFVASREADPEWSPPDVFDDPDRLSFNGRPSGPF